MVEIQNRLNYAQAVADWFLELGDGHMARGDFEAALKCNYIASGVLSLQNRDLVSIRIESNLRAVAGRLAELGELRSTAPTRDNRRATCLHVLSEALPAGGLTAMATRWMKHDGARVHSVALLAQQIPVPATLQQAVTAAGGAIHQADADGSFVGRAIWLRNLALQEADYVILHVDVADVICSVAFGVPGGPPVLLVNHAAHLYWNGACMADKVVNCRGSALETFWSSHYRGVGAARCAIVPIPLLEPAPANSADASKAERRQRLREQLGAAPDSLVILTVGSSFKYLPIDGLDFLEVWEQILKQVPEAILVAVGFEGDARWQEASRRVGSRIRTLGTVPHSRLLEIQDGADLYAEAFPFGTTTSLLEAGLKGIAVSLPPVQSPPPYGTDGVALDEILERPTAIGEYQSKNIRLCRDAAERAALGDRVRHSILRHHCGAGWREHLDAALQSLPREHALPPGITPVRTPESVHERWSVFVPRWTAGYETLLELAVTRALAIGLRPRLSRTVVRACREHRALRAGRTVALPVLRVLCNFILPLLPGSLACNVFRLSAFLFRGSLWSRVPGKMAQLLGRGGEPPSPYDEYRKMSDASGSSRKPDADTLATQARN